MVRWWDPEAEIVNRIPVVKTTLPVQGARVRPWSWKLRSRMPCGAAQKEKKWGILYCPVVQNSRIHKLISYFKLLILLPAKLFCLPVGCPSCAVCSSLGLPFISSSMPCSFFIEQLQPHLCQEGFVVLKACPVPLGRNAKGSLGRPWNRGQLLQGKKRQEQPHGNTGVQSNQRFTGESCFFKQQHHRNKHRKLHGDRFASWIPQRIFLFHHLMLLNHWVVV